MTPDEITPAATEPLDPIATAFSETLSRISQPGWESDGRACGFVGVEFDSLSHNVPIERWDNLRHKLNNALREIKPKYKLAVLAMARDEAPYLAEWIAHYLSIGVEHLFVYTNDNSDGTDELLRWFGKNAPVTPIFTTAAPGINIQKKNYEHAFLLLPELRLYEWVVVVDADEFLLPSERYNLDLIRMLGAAPADAAAVVFPWKWRLWDLRFERSPGLLAERFQHAIPHFLFKSAVRMRRAISLCEVHIPTTENHQDLYDTDFKKIEPDQIWSQTPKSCEGGWIEHFWGRSFEEFLVKKTRGELLAIPTGQFKRDFKTYFDWTSPYSDANFDPMPALAVERMKVMLDRFTTSSTFSELRDRLASRCDVMANQLRNESSLRVIFENALDGVYPDN